MEDNDMQNGILNFDLENIRLKRLAESKALEDGDSPIIAIQSEYDDDDQEEPEDGIEDLLYKKTEQMDIEGADLEEVDINQDGQNETEKIQKKSRPKKAKKINKELPLPDRENEHSTVSVKAHEDVLTN